MLAASVPSRKTRAIGESWPRTGRPEPQPGRARRSRMAPSSRPDPTWSRERSRKAASDTPGETRERHAAPPRWRPMAILAALFAFGSKFVGKILTTALGWASTLLSVACRPSRQYLLLGITFGSVIWMVLLVGRPVPGRRHVPARCSSRRRRSCPEGVIRLIMLIGAVVVPPIIGALTLALTPAEPRTARAIVEAVLRGYPLTLLLAVLLVFLAGLAIWRKAWSLAKRLDGRPRPARRETRRVRRSRRRPRPGGRPPPAWTSSLGCPGGDVEAGPLAGGGRRPRRPGRSSRNASSSSRAGTSTS